MSVNNDATKEARRVVEEIAGDNGVFTPERRALETPASLRTIDNLKGIALAAAQKLAGDLYDKPTHFILESIQNADDNAYAPGVLPKLRLYHSVGCIWMDCNELGFEEAHVRALCNVGKSTKGSGKGRQEGYIGEKGIGFKSIFKVAERVHINSPPYSFDLDGSREMGMITPRWVVPDPEPSLSRMGYQTQLTLLPPDGKDFRSLADAFREIRPTLLIFLRRLKSIEVTVSPCFGVAAFHTSYTTTWASDSESVTIDALEMGLAGKRQERRKYLVVKDRFGRLPKEPLRTDINSTEVVLAFPVDEDANLVDETQSVHAFLPVRDIGLKMIEQFVVQADFLLTSNRQDVHGASPWNLRLRECVVSTFVKAMARFREAEGLRHTWIRYLPDDGAEDFWGGLKNGILEKIKSQPVLLSRDGRLAVPNALKSIEAGFLDRYGAPLAGPDSTFISPRYSPGDVHILERLGVGTLGRWRGLIRHLNAWDPAEFASRSEAWHEDFADVYFRQSIFQRQTLAPDLLPLPLIPLEGGSWARSSRYNGGGAIYFRGPPGLREIPADVKLRLVDAKASQHNSRRELFKAMGVTECRVGDVASLIFTMHESPSPPPFAKAIAHVRYIFGHESARDDPRSAQLWLFDSNWSAVKGPALYLDTDAGPFSPFRLFNKQQSSRFAARFLHGDYNVPQEEKVRWTRWLKESLRVQTIPKLGDGDQISADFAFILKEWPQHVLELLRTHWGIYRLLMTIGIRRAIEKFEVSCSDGRNMTLQPLRGTIAPEPTLRDEAARLCSPVTVSFLRLDHYSRQDWVFLSYFGVHFDLDLPFYLGLLEQISLKKPDDWTHASSLYHCIGRQAAKSQSARDLAKYAVGDFHLNSIRLTPKRKTFLAGIRIYYDASFWSVKNCVWDAPDGFTARKALKSTYGDDEDTLRLFHEIIGIKNASPAAVLRHLENRSLDNTPFEQWLSIYRYLSDALEAKVIVSEDRDVMSARQQVHAASRQRAFLLLRKRDGESLVTTNECVWDSPVPLPGKNVLKSTYMVHEFMPDFLRNVLEIHDATSTEVCLQLAQSNRGGCCSLKHAQKIYAYIHCRLKHEDVGYICSTFEAASMIYVPIPEGWKWLKPSECVWRTADHLTHVTPLVGHYSNNKNATYFIRNTLGVGDAGLRHYVEELRLLSIKQDMTSIEVKHVSQLYTDIQRFGVSDQSYLRQMFGEHALIYISGRAENSWRRLAECVWHGAQALKSRVSLSRRYAMFSELFQTFLEIENATPKMLLDEIQDISCTNAEPSAEQVKSVKDLLMGLNDFAKDSKRPGMPEGVCESLKTQRCWPCQQGTATTTFVSLDARFFINDRRDIAALFQGTIPILDCTVEEVGQLEHLLKIISLDDRYLSKTEGTNESLGPKFVDGERTARWKMKAEAIARCALHRRVRLSPEYKIRLRQKLRSVTVFTVDSIRYSFLINSQGFNIRKDDKGFVKMDLDAENPTIELPRDSEDAAVAVVDHLPKGLIAFLKIFNPAAQETLKTIIALPTPRTVEATLDRNGIDRLAESPTASEIDDPEEVMIPGRSTEAVAEPSPDRPTPDLPRPMSFTPMASLERENRSHSGSALNVISRSLSQILDAPREESRTPTPSRGSIDLQHISAPIFAVGSISAARKARAPADPTRQAPPPVSPPPPPPASPSPPRRSAWELPSRNEIGEVLGDTTARRERVVNAARAFDVGQVEVISSLQALRPTSRPALAAAFNFSELAAALPETPLIAVNTIQPARTTAEKSGFVTNEATVPSPRGNTSSRGFAPRTDRQRARDFGIGFEGELFVVEALQQRFPYFNKERDWTSKLRRYDPEMSEYRHAEITDITYADTDGQMTAWLYELQTNGRQEVPTWLRRAREVNFDPSLSWPTFYLEVKSTTAACQTPLFISRNQYRTMERMTVATPPSGAGSETENEEATTPREIYVLVRVYESPGTEKKIRLYLDPWALRNSLLVIEPVEYSIVPRDLTAAAASSASEADASPVADTSFATISTATASALVVDLSMDLDGFESEGVDEGD